MSTFELFRFNHTDAQIKVNKVIETSLYFSIMVHSELVITKLSYHYENLERLIQVSKFISENLLNVNDSESIEELKEYSVYNPQIEVINYKAKLFKNLTRITNNNFVEQCKVLKSINDKTVNCKNKTWLGNNVNSNLQLIIDKKDVNNFQKLTVLNVFRTIATHRQLAK